MLLGGRSQLTIPVIMWVSSTRLTSELVCAYTRTYINTYVYIYVHIHVHARIQASPAASPTHDDIVE